MSKPLLESMEFRFSQDANCLSELKQLINRMEKAITYPTKGKPR